MNDRTTVNLVVGGLGVVALVCILGIVVLAAMGRAIPEILGLVGTTDVGALAGVLSQTNTHPPTPVQPLTEECP